MSQPALKIETIEQLRQFVSRTLCHNNDLEVGIFQMTERVLTRGNRQCGIHFCLHGPRSVKLSAIWENEKNTILFYNAGGARFHRSVLPHQLALK